jgi:hypothetical protein
MDGPDHASGDVGQQDRHAVGGAHHQYYARKTRDQGVRDRVVLASQLCSFSNDRDVGTVHLSHPDHDRQRHPRWEVGSAIRVGAVVLGSQGCK